LQLQIDRAALGRVGLPGEPLANLLQTLSQAAPEALSHPQVQSLLDLLSQRRQVTPIFELEDGRRIQLLDVRLGEGVIDLTVLTVDGQ
jgi:hypothetical protein